MRSKRSRTSAPPEGALPQEPETMRTPSSPPLRPTALGLRSGILSRRLLGESTLTPPAWWQRQLVGYLLALPLVAGGVAGALQFERFPTASLLSAIFVTALLW